MKKKSALTVLVVDDDELARELMRLMLVGAGITVLETDSGIQALQALYAGLLPDVIILDAMMPDINGFEVCRKIRLLPQLSATPIILLDARDDNVSLQKAMRAGATEFMRKPVQHPEFAEQIQQFARIKTK
jgi:CheY-like chemotaxis protein